MCAATVENIDDKHRARKMKSIQEHEEETISFRLLHVKDKGQFREEMHISISDIDKNNFTLMKR